MPFFASMMLFVNLQLLFVFQATFSRTDGEEDDHLCRVRVTGVVPDRLDTLDTTPEPPGHPGHPATTNDLHDLCSLLSRQAETVSLKSQLINLTAANIQHLQTLSPYASGPPPPTPSPSHRSRGGHPAHHKRHDQHLTRRRPPRTFAAEIIFGPFTTRSELMADVLPLLCTAHDNGGNAVVPTYGRSGRGKSFTTSQSVEGCAEFLFPGDASCCPNSFSSSSASTMVRHPPTRTGLPSFVGDDSNVYITPQLNHIAAPPPSRRAGWVPERRMWVGDAAGAGRAEGRRFSTPRVAGERQRALTLAAATRIVLQHYQEAGALRPDRRGAGPGDAVGVGDEGKVEACTEGGAGLRGRVRGWEAAQRGVGNESSGCGWTTDAGTRIEDLLGRLSRYGGYAALLERHLGELVWLMGHAMRDLTAGVAE
ncbi:hypothetical protein CONLIGDRAFT_718690 [Coniochaeta ligniaria NRRL 30616]|uniref:Kinesin motor domain-containing protein n=1 Tax=Coniochaeta ligniaria NRRL 30616 TaxID=1408157 RepID=A0A1J7I9U4_9PEZI|nr:hypothetical protein CONLIGDRAFT_718690 [Coniochaeta ligniaria NRRL 30616]